MTKQNSERLRNKVARYFVQMRHAEHGVRVLLLRGVIQRRISPTSSILGRILTPQPIWFLSAKHFTVFFCERNCERNWERNWERRRPRLLLTNKVALSR
jgi:hypothetical protein